MSNKLIISETFTSIQGESTHAGCLCFFIRLSGCNLNCSYCDTEHAQALGSGSEMAMSDIVKLAEEASVKLVEITGGEPLLQDNVLILCEKLLAKDFRVLIETNGSLSISQLPKNVIKIMDCKTPSSNEAEKNNFENFKYLTLHDEVKFVITDQCDYQYALDVIKKYKLNEITENILFSAGWNTLPNETLVEWMVKDNVPGRLQLQLHKYIWDPNKIGV